MDIGSHIGLMQMHQSRTLLTNINDLEDDGGANNNNISFADAASRRPLTGNVSTSNSHDTFRQNEHNLAMMQDIVIEQILSGDLHGNSFHSHSSVNTNPSSNRSTVDGQSGIDRSGHVMLSSNSMSNSSAGSKFSRFASTKIPLVSQIMAPYRDNPALTRSAMDDHSHSYSDDYNRHRFPPRGHHGAIDLNHIEMIEEINLHEDHDQLPNVESYKASVYHRSNKNSSSPWYGSRSRIRYVLTIVSGLCICIFFTLLGVIIGRRNNRSDANDYGVLPPSPTNDVATSGYVEPQNRYAALVALVVDEKWSKSELLEKADSAQLAAIEWIAKMDTMKVPITADSIQLKQRYALAVMFYALNGLKWNTQFFFLSGEKSECDWFNYWALNKNTTRPTVTLIDGNTTTIDDEDDADVSKVGVICNTAGAPEGVVSRIYMPANNLHGEMPAELALLTDLREINFYNNELTGIIHGTFSALTKLEAFVLYQNQIRDVIPTWLGTTMASSLQVLNWGKNDIYGVIPSNFGALTKLTTFNCESCNIQGTLSPLQDMETLEAIHLGGNSLNGQFSESLFGSWPKLMELDLSDNQLEGSLPRGILDNEHLLVVDLHSNKFTGPVYDINPGSNVRVLSLHNNQLSGRVDTIISNLNEKIQHLDLSNNLFVGSGLPPSIARLTDLRYLFLAFNKFDREPIPAEIGQLTKLRDLSLQSSSRIGTIPYQIKNCNELTLLDLNDNDLSGQIPDEIGALSSLRFLMLRENSLSGSIPESFYQLTNLDTLLINTNRNIGGDTNAICQPALPSLRIFRAHCDKFTGTSPKTQCPCCTACCDVDATDLCNLDDFFTNIDPSSEYQYVRRFYHFNEQDVIFPVASVALEETPLAGTNVDYYSDIAPQDSPDGPAGGVQASQYFYDGNNNGQTPSSDESLTGGTSVSKDFEEYYEDENGEDTADTEVIDSFPSGGRSPKFQYKDVIDPSLLENGGD